jgi:hypothetical protein
VDDSIREPARSSIQYRVPVYEVACGANVILWQVDTAFDEEYYCVTDIIKGSGYSRRIPVRSAFDSCI